MATKREAVAQLTVEDLKLLASAADEGVKSSGIFLPKDQRKIKRAAKILRTVRAAQ